MIRSVSSIVLWAFLFAVYVVHYETRFFPGTVHSWLLVAGVVVALPQIARRRLDRLPMDYVLVGLLGLIVLVSFAANIEQATTLSLQAYLLSVLCYVFIRTTAPYISLERFYAFNAVFLLVNSALMLLQFMTGGYFIAHQIVASVPEVIVPSGLADGPTKNGLIQAVALSIALGRLVFLRTRAISLDGVALTIGAAALLLTTSRAGVAAFAIAAVALVPLHMTARRRSTTAAVRPRRLVGAAAMGAVALSLVVVTSRYILSEERETFADEIATNILSYKFYFLSPAGGEYEDPSIATRYAAVRTVVAAFAEDPVQVVLGSGVGSFTEVFERVGPTIGDVGTDVEFDGLSTHNAYLEFVFECGVVGLFVLAWLQTHVIRQAIRAPDFGNRAPLLLALVAAAAFLMFHDLLRGRVYWTLLAMLAAWTPSRSSVPAVRRTEIR